jgi:hypothetical protein
LPWRYRFIALLDALREEHVAQERDAIVERQVLGYFARRIGARGLGCHQACCSLRGRGPAWIAARRASLTPVAGISGPRGAPLARLSRVATLPFEDGRGPWQTRLLAPRARCRGVRGRRGAGRLLEALPVTGDDGPGLFAAFLLAELLNLCRVAVPAPLAGRRLRRRRPGSDGDRHRPCGRRCSPPRARWSLLGLLPLDRARRPDDLSVEPPGRGAHRPRRHAPREFRPTPTTSHRQARRRPLPHVRRRADRRAFCVLGHRPVAPAVTRDPTSARTRRWRGRDGGSVLRALAALRRKGIARAPGRRGGSRSSSGASCRKDGR